MAAVGLFLYGGTVTLWVAASLALLAMAYVCLLMTAMVIQGGIWLLRSLEGWYSENHEDSEALTSSLMDNWSAELWHGPGDERMVTAVVSRVAELAPPGDDHVMPAVLCALSRITSSSAQRELRALPDVRFTEIGDERVLTLGPGRLHLERHANAGMAGGVIMLLLAVPVLMLFQANLVAEIERGECHGRCAGRPVEFGQAFSWLVDAFSWGVLSSGYEPASVRAKVFAGGDQLLLVVVLGCVLVAFRRSIRRKRDAEERVRSTLSAITPRTRTIVVLTALSFEYKAVRRHLEEIRETRRVEGTIFEIGTLPSMPCKVALVMMGAGNYTAAAITERAIRAFQPSALLLVGVAGALRDYLELGDIVVGDRVYGYHSGREGPDGFRARPRVIELSHELVQIAGHLERTGAWTEVLRNPHGDPPKVHIRPIAAGEQVLNSLDSETAQRIRTHYDDAVAIEMGGIGSAQASHLNRSLPTLIIRAVSNRVDGTERTEMDRKWQPIAAANAAAFAIAVIRHLPAEDDPRPM
ncbi:MAG TPA: 5'-methylthioadenosine/S-adenosylhomocysteine nucleosidase [Actinoallomurus sp.]